MGIASTIPWKHLQLDYGDSLNRAWGQLQSDHGDSFNQLLQSDYRDSFNQAIQTASRTALTGLGDFRKE